MIICFTVHPDSLRGSSGVILLSMTSRAVKLIPSVALFLRQMRPWWRHTCACTRTASCSQYPHHYNICAGFDLFGSGYSPASPFQNIFRLRSTTRPSFPYSIKKFEFGCKGITYYLYGNYVIMVVYPILNFNQRTKRIIIAPSFDFIV